MPLALEVLFAVLCPTIAVAVIGYLIDRSDAANSGPKMDKRA